MSHASPEHHGAAVPASPPLFPAADWSAFQTEDRSAGGFVVGLMFAIFSIGLVLYLIVAYFVNATPNAQY